MRRRSQAALVLAALVLVRQRAACRKGKQRSMSRLPSNRSGQSFVEFALIIILFAIVLLSILLILGDDLRTFINDLFQTWFPA